ncbi:transferase family-domain-containing protein [Lasiosphaeria hispida]|uniref:Transferase family-domain-containing protein n=1 Tax=Lasiosphaeria hispida TaxID=260671 RepID=A0AAJ0M8M0_9PEZI|nr:transferase family-domain-containing protein [Lasiosphaeria hispida]
MAEISAREAWIHSLEETLPMTSLDQTAPKGVIRLVFGFGFPNHRRVADQILIQKEAFDFLRSRLRSSLLRWPFLGGQVVQAEGDEHFQLVYSNDPLKFGFFRYKREVFDAQWMDLPGVADYNELQMLGGPGEFIPPSAMDKDLLSLSPDLLAKHPVTLRLSFIPGGLLLCFSFDHRVMDGGAVVEFLNFFASETVLTSTQSVTPLVEAKEKIIEMEKCAALSQYDIGDNVLYPSADSSASPSVAKVFLFTAEAVEKLHEFALAHLASRYGRQAFVSKIDVICGLVWLHATRVRQHRLKPDDTTHFISAADIRSRVSPPLGAGYIGNMFVRLVSVATVKDLLDGAGARTREDIVAEAAWRIRKTVENLGSPEYVANCIKLAGHPNPRKSETIFHAGLHRATSFVDNSSWVGLGADVEFKIPGTHYNLPGTEGGKAQWVRKGYSARGMTILPRQGGTRGDALWEVVIALRADDMGKIRGEEELGRYTSENSYVEYFVHDSD